MSEARKAFEALMRIDGHTDFTMKSGRYKHLGMQLRWRWFLTGWEMRGLQ